MEITQYRDEFKTEVIELILDIQNNEAKVNMPIECQPDLLGITDAYINRGGDFWVAIADGHVVGTLALMRIDDQWAVLKKFLSVPTIVRARSVWLFTCVCLSLPGQWATATLFSIPRQSQRRPTPSMNVPVSAGLKNGIAGAV